MQRRLDRSSAPVLPALESTTVPLFEDLVFQGSGVLHRGAFYVTRSADAELPAALLAGEHCYVLAPRQSGKSSLRVRVQAPLQGQGAVCVTLDLAAIGTPPSPESWYYALCEHLAHQLSLPSPEAFYTRDPLLPPHVRFQRYLRDEVITRLAGHLILFIDEVDVTLSLPFPRSDFFSVLRALNDGRVEDPALQRLTLCLLGSAPLFALISDPARTPFGVTRTLELGDLTPSESRAFLAGLPRQPHGPQAWLEAILYWTAGHPALTQRLCQALAEGWVPTERRSPSGMWRAVDRDELQEAAVSGAPAEEIEERSAVAGLVRTLFLDRGLDEVPALAAIDRAFDKSNPRTASMLALYRRLIDTTDAGGDPAATSPVDRVALWRRNGPLRGPRLAVTRRDEPELALRASGLVVEEGDEEGPFLVVRNRVFALVFNDVWARRRAAERYLAPALSRWLERGRVAAALLQGEDLAAALAWSRGRLDVDPDERELLLSSLAAARAADKATAESQAVARALQSKDERERERRRQRAVVQALLGGLIGLLLVMVGLAVDGARARGARAEEAQARTQAERAREARDRELLAEQAAHQRTREQLGGTETALAAARHEVEDARRALGRGEVRLKEVEGKVVSINKKRLPQQHGEHLDGDVDEDMVDKVMMQQGWPALRRCYPAAALVSALRVEVRVNTGGAVDAEQAAGAEATCVSEALRGLRFAHLPGVQYARIVYQFQARGR